MTDRKTIINTNEFFHWHLMDRLDPQKRELLEARIFSKVSIIEIITCLAVILW